MPSAADRLFSVSVRVNGKENPDFYKCIQSIKVEEDIRQGSSFEIVVSLCRNDDGSWPHLEEAEMQPWNRMTIRATLGEATDVVLDGYLSDAHVSTTPATASLQANFAGVDASYVMNLATHCKDWRGKTYEQIAKEIIEKKEYGLKAILPPSTAAAGSTPPPSVTQRHTDLRFLRELARRRGYEFFVRGGDTFFGPPDLESTPQKTIAINFGEKTNCEDLQISVDGTRPTEAVVTRQHPLTGEPQTNRAPDSGLRPLGTTGLEASRGYGVPPTRIIPRWGVGPPTDANVETASQATMARHGFWLHARGTLNGLRYGAILRAGKLVTIMGFGESFNGVYHVRKVIHQFTPRTYQLRFEAYRNRKGKTGSEDFTVEDPSDTAAPPALGPGAGDLTRVREDGNQVMPA
jgi:hypothetical protein